MPIEFPEALQTLGQNNNDLLEKWLNQMVTVRTELPKERISMPSMLTSDNLSTWLSTRYASRNKARETGLEANKKIRQQRKKSSSSRAPNIIDSEEYVDWLTPKRAKVVESTNNAKLETSFPSPINFYDTDSGLLRSVSSEPSNLLSSFNKQACRLTNEDWYKACNTRNNKSETFGESSTGLLSPYFEASSNMKVDDWLAKNQSALPSDSPFSEWLHCPYRAGRRKSSGSVSTSSRNGADDITSALKHYLPQSDATSTNEWLANQTAIINWDSQGEDIQDDDDDESLLEGLVGLNIDNNSSFPDSSWLCYTPVDHAKKSESERTWILDDYGSCTWTKEATSDNATSLTNLELFDDVKDEQIVESNRSTPFNINDWLVVVDNEYDKSSKTDNMTDDGSSIVVLSMSD